MSASAPRPTDERARKPHGDLGWAVRRGGAAEAGGAYATPRWLSTTTTVRARMVTSSQIDQLSM